MDKLVHTVSTILYGIVVHEPGSVISNVLLGIIALIFFLKISKLEKSKEVIAWSIFMLTISISSFGGIFTHGFPTYFPLLVLFWIWSIKNGIINISIYYGQIGAIKNLTFQDNDLLRYALIIKSVTCFILSAVYISFFPIVFDLGTGYILIICCSIIKMNRGMKESKNILLGFLIVFLSGFLFVFKLGYSELWLSYKDVAHFFVILALIAIYSGVKKIDVSESLPVFSEV